MKKILITGKNSYIGTAVEGHLKQFSSMYRVDTLDMLEESWRESTFAGYDCVFHVAGIAHVPAGKLNKEQLQAYYRVNCDLAIETAKKAKQEGVKQFIFMSSAIVYGDSGAMGVEKRIDRDTVPAPKNAYADSKWRAEKGLEKLKSADFAVAVLRPPMIYGAGCKGNYPLLSKAARILPCFPKVSNQRSMLYVGHLTAFVQAVIDEGRSGVFWPQNAQYVNTSEMVRMIASAHGRKMWLVPGFEGLLKLLSRRIGLLNKVFGNLTYGQELSDDRTNYRPLSLRETIEMTEGRKRES